MKRKFLWLILLLFVSPAFADDLMDSSKLNMRPVESLNMSGLLPAYVKTNGKFTETAAPEYNLSRMKQMNPDFTTYQEATGIIWLKHSLVSRSDTGGTEITRLYVILGRRGLGGKWLNWNIPVPANGSAEILEATAYDFTSLAEISEAVTEEDSQAGIIRVNFQGLPETFILAVAWKESLPSQLSVEGMCWFQEDLRVWESIVEVYSPQRLAYKTFPDIRSPEIDEDSTGTSYTWRRINLDPYTSAGELARLQRAGVVFGSRKGTSGAAGLIKDAENVGNVNPDSEALSGFKRSKKDGTLKLIDWLKNRETIELAEGSPRKIPGNGALTQEEKVLLARSWLAAQKVEASVAWQLPFEPDENSPMCAGMFRNPVLEVQGVKGIDFHDMTDPKLLAGAKIFSVNSDGRFFSRKIPSSKSTDNRLSAIMELQLDEGGRISGTVRVLMRGAWGALMLGNSPTDGTARGALLSLFPGLTNYKDVKYRSVKGVPEVSFKLENKPGVGGTGRGILAILPFFEPVAMRKLGGYEAPVEVLFPFVVDQNITLGFPKNASQALVENKVSKNPDKINYSESYLNKRHRLIADSRFEVNMNSITSGNMPLLQRHLDNWRAFSARQIPVR
ncbi:MAG: hypothetical protein IJR85_05795 [Synergistaceae bacterium]|nr:hypothetical protein [Synergistaceae bacterium]